MKIIVLFLTIFLSIFLNSISYCYAENARTNQEESQRREQAVADLWQFYATEHTIADSKFAHRHFKERYAQSALDQAVEDISLNTAFLLLLKEEFGEVFHLAWAIPIADKLPSQPVAVVQLIAAANALDTRFDYTEFMCPFAVIEDSVPYLQYKNWMEHSILSLESFIMADTAAEAVRSTCIAKIKHALTTYEPW